MIQTGQPLYATKFLMPMSDTFETNKTKDEKLNVDISDWTFDRGRNFVLMGKKHLSLDDFPSRFTAEIIFGPIDSGDAYMAYGNYPQAKKFYGEAVMLRSDLPQGTKAMCYNILLEELMYRVRGIPQYTKGAKSQRKDIEKSELAISLERLSIASMVRNRLRNGPRKARGRFNVDRRNFSYRRKRRWPNWPCCKAYV